MKKKETVQPICVNCKFGKAPPRGWPIYCPKRGKAVAYGDTCIGFMPKAAR